MEETLIELMARFRALSLYYQLVHWTLKGSWFYQDHLLADRLYGDVNDVIDEIAEKGIGASGSTAHVMLPDVLVRVMEILQPYPMVADESNVEFWEALLQMERELTIWMDGAAKSMDDLGVQNMLIGFLEEGHQRVYLVRARCRGYGPDSTHGDNTLDKDD